MNAVGNAGRVFDALDLGLASMRKELGDVAEQVERIREELREGDEGQVA